MYCTCTSTRVVYIVCICTVLPVHIHVHVVCTCACTYICSTYIHHTCITCLLHVVQKQLTNVLLILVSSQFFIF